MDVLRLLIPVSLFLGGVGLVAFLWTLRSNQYEDPDGDSRRILTDAYDDRPKLDHREGSPQAPDRDEEDETPN